MGGTGGTFNVSESFPIVSSARSTMAALQERRKKMLSETKTVRLQKLNITKTSYFNRKRFHCQASRKQNTRQKEDVLYQQWSHLSLLKQHWLNTPWRSSVTVVYLKYPTCTGCKTPLHLWINTVCPLILFEYFSLLSYLHWINYPSK